MSLETMIAKIRSRADYKRCGMVLYHNGLCRETSRDGRPVEKLVVHVDDQKLETILSRQRHRQGIAAVEVEIYTEQELFPGDDVMVLAVAGDVRENVKAVLGETLELIKTEATWKDEYLK